MAWLLPLVVTFGVVQWNLGGFVTGHHVGELRCLLHGFTSDCICLQHTGPVVDSVGGCSATAGSLLTDANNVSCNASAPASTIFVCCTV